MAEVLARLQREFGCDSVKAAEAKLKQLDEEAKLKEMDFAHALATFQEEHPL